MFQFEQLWHYSEKFTRDQDLRQDLVIMAWQQDLRFGDRSDIRLLKNYMKLRAKEISVRNSLGKAIGGKTLLDAYSRQRVSIFKRVAGDNQFCLADTITSVGRDPFGSAVVDQFENALPELEANVAEQMVAGYTDKEGSETLQLRIGDYRRLKLAVQEKAMEYLA